VTETSPGCDRWVERAAVGDPLGAEDGCAGRDALERGAAGFAFRIGPAAAAPPPAAAPVDDGSVGG
jgi:hypothetical protein